MPEQTTLPKNQSPILIARYFTASNVKRWVKLGYVCQVEVLDFYKTARSYTVKREKKKGISIHEGNEVSEITLPDIFKGSQCRTLVFTGKNTLISKVFQIIGYCIVKLFQLIPKHINFEQQIHLYSFRFSGHSLRLVKTPHLLYHGTGLMALRFSPDLLKKASEGISTVLVTGTNGKTTVTKMIHNGMKAAGIDAVWNPTGANMLGGIATPFFENLRFGKPHSKWAVMECDEAWLMDVAPIIKPEIIIVTNISLDSDKQFIRFPNPEITSHYIERAIHDSRPKYVVCGEELQLDTSDTNVTTIKYQVTETMRCSIPGHYNLKNVAAARACLKLLGFDSDKVNDTVYDTPPAYGRSETFDIHGKKVILMYAKNIEGISLTLDYLESLKEKVNIIFYVCAEIDSKGHHRYSGWMTDGVVAGKLKKIDCNIFTGGFSGDTLGDLLFEHFVSEGLFPMAKLTSPSSIIPTIDKLEGPIFVICNSKLLEIIRLMRSYRSIQQKTVFG